MMKKRDVKISTISLLSITTLFVAASILTVLLVNHQMKQQAISEAVLKSRLLLDRNLATHSYFSHEMKPRIFAWSEPFRNPDTFEPTWMSSTYAVRAIDKHFRALSPVEYYYKECAVHARSPENEADDFERAFIERLNADPDLEFWSGVRTIDGKLQFVALRKGEVVETSCLRCHGEPEDAPGNLVQHYGNTRSFHRRVGEVSSAVSIRIPLEAAYGDADVFSLRLSGMLLLVLAVLLAGHYFIGSRLVFAPLARIRRKALEISQSDTHLGDEIPPPLGSDLAELTAAFNTMSRRLRENRDNLEQMVYERTRELEESNLRLADSEAEKATILNNMSEVVLLYDTDRRLIYANKAGREFFGEPVERIVGKTCTELFHRSGECCRNCALSRAQRTGELHEEEGAYTPDSTWVVRAIPIRNENGEIKGFVQIARDITAQKRAEKALSEQLVFLQELIDSIPNPIFYKDLNGIYQGCNKAYEQFLNRPRSSIVGNTVQFLAPADLAEDCMETDRQLLETRASIQYHHKLQHPDGTVSHLLFNKALLSSPEGTPSGMVGVISDITENKRLEEQLHHVQKMEAIGTLAGGIAHDFNNILGAIMGYSELVLMDLPPDSHESRCIREVIHAAHRARDLVKQILSFSRRDKTERLPLQIASPVKETLKLLRATLPTTIEIRQRVQTESLILGDPTEIHQVVMNLCTNAAQAMRGQSGVLEVTLSDLELRGMQRLDFHNLPPGRYVKLTVSDTGTGIDPSIKDRIFDPYFTTKPPGAGTGLGLAIVHGIVASSGGAIHVESQPGKGSRFVIYFPVLEKGVTEDDGEDGEIPGGSERVLFVDDEEKLVVMGTMMLEHLGYRVVGKTSSAEAFREFLQDPDGFDAVVTDMTMPFMTGADLARRMMEVRPHLPVILYTGHSDLIDEDRARALGIKAFLMKPLRMMELARCLRRVLEHRET